MFPGPWTGPLQFMIPELLRTNHKEWEEDSLDGPMTVVDSAVTGEREVTLFGLDYLITSQKLVALEVTFTLTKSLQGFERLKVRLGEHGDGVHGLVCYHGSDMESACEDILERRESIQWKYHATYDYDETGYYYEEANSASRADPVDPISAKWKKLTERAEAAFDQYHYGKAHRLYRMALRMMGHQLALRAADADPVESTAIEAPDLLANLMTAAETDASLLAKTISDSTGSAEAVWAEVSLLIRARNWHRILQRVPFLLKKFPKLLESSRSLNLHFAALRAAVELHRPEATTWALDQIVAEFSRLPQFRAAFEKHLAGIVAGATAVDLAGTFRSWAEREELSPPLQKLLNRKAGELEALSVIVESSNRSGADSL